MHLHCYTLDNRITARGAEQLGIALEYNRSLLLLSLRGAEALFFSFFLTFRLLTRLSLIKGNLDMGDVGACSIISALSFNSTLRNLFLSSTRSLSLSLR